tara:strand:- start:2159 stop:2560 length:402 start_codon:yes stop_codon:yes gene_type:complete
MKIPSHLSQSITLPNEIISLILYKYGGLMTPSAIAMNEAFKNKELVRDIKDIDKNLYFFYEKELPEEYLIIDNKITWILIPLTKLPDGKNEYLIPSFIYGSFFRHNVLSYKTHLWDLEEYITLDRVLDQIYFL